MQQPIWVSAIHDLCDGVGRLKHPPSPPPPLKLRRTRKLRRAGEPHEWECVFPQRRSRLRFRAMPSQGGAEENFYRRERKERREKIIQSMNPILKILFILSKNFSCFSCVSWAKHSTSKFELQPPSLTNPSVSPCPLRLKTAERLLQLL